MVVSARFFAVRFLVCLAYMIIHVFRSTALALTWLICKSFKADFTEMHSPTLHGGSSSRCLCTCTVGSRFLGTCSLAFPRTRCSVVLPWTSPMACLQGIWSFWELLDFPGLCRRFDYGQRPGFAGWF